MKYPEFKNLIESCAIEICKTTADCGGEYHDYELLPMHIDDTKLRKTWMKIRKKIRSECSREAGSLLNLTPLNTSES